MAANQTPIEPRGLREAIEAGNKQLEAMTPEQRAAKVEQEAKDEADLLDWYENRGGKDQQLHPIIERRLRVASHNRGDDAIYEAQRVAKIEAENAAASPGCQGYQTGRACSGAKAGASRTAKASR